MRHFDDGSHFGTGFLRKGPKEISFFDDENLKVSIVNIYKNASDNPSFKRVDYLVKAFGDLGLTAAHGATEVILLSDSYRILFVPRFSWTHEEKGFEYHFSWTHEEKRSSVVRVFGATEKSPVNPS